MILPRIMTRIDSLQSRHLLHSLSLPPPSSALSPNHLPHKSPWESCRTYGPCGPLGPPAQRPTPAAPTTSAPASPCLRAPRDIAAGTAATACLPASTETISSTPSSRPALPPPPPSAAPRTRSSSATARRSGQVFLVHFCLLLFASLFPSSLLADSLSRSPTSKSTASPTTRKNSASPRSVLRAPTRCRSKAGRATDDTMQRLQEPVAGWELYDYENHTTTWSTWTPGGQAMGCSKNTPFGPGALRK